ncbi:WXG100 family type VII secretion target [Micromonospora sp. NPDC003197]
MSQITVQFGALDMGVDTLSSTHAKMLDQIRALEEVMQPLSEAWDGTAQAAYRSCQSDWGRAAQEIGQVIGKLKSAVAEANQVMQERERANTAIAGG